MHGVILGDTDKTLVTQPPVIPEILLEATKVVEDNRGLAGFQQVCRFCVQGR